MNEPRSTNFRSGERGGPWENPSPLNLIESTPCSLNSDFDLPLHVTTVQHTFVVANTISELVATVSANNSTSHRIAIVPLTRRCDQFVYLTLLLDAPY